MSTHTAVPALRLRELDKRSFDGITVVLFWNTVRGDIELSVQDERNQASYWLDQIEPENASDAFNHPFVYLAQRSPEQLTSRPVQAFFDQDED